MAPSYPTKGSGFGYHDPLTKFMQQPFRPTGPTGPTLPAYLRDRPAPPYKPGRYYSPAPLPGIDPTFYSPKPLPGQKQMFPGLFGSPGQVPTVPYKIPAKIPYGLLARFLTVNPYIRAGSMAIDILGGLQPLPVTSLTRGAYDMTGWTLDCSAPTGAPWDKVTGIGPFGPPPLPCVTPLLIPAETYGEDLTASGAANWVWLAFGPGTLGGIRMDGEEQWRRALPGPVPPWIAGFPFWERHPIQYNPLNPDSWLPGQPITLLPRIPYQAIPGRKYPPQGDGRTAPRADNGPSPATGNPPYAPPVSAPGPKPKRPPFRKPGVKRRTLPAIVGGSGGGGPAKHDQSPPGPRVKERKYTPKNYAKWKAAADKVATILEFADIVKAVYDALPWQVRSWKGKDGKWRDKDPTIQSKIARILTNLNQLDMAKVVENIVANELEDKFFGKLGKLGKDATTGLRDSGQWGGLLGLGAGPGV